VSEHDIQVSLLVVGGGPAALSSATAYRDQGGTGPVMMISDDDSLPYFRPALSKDYLRADVREDQLGLAEPASYRRRGIEVRLSRSVASVDPVDRSARLFDGTRLRYQSCVLATGATPKPLPLPGADDRRVGYLRSLRNAHSLRTAAEHARSAVVIGSGFIGCEAAASLAQLGVEVTVVSTEQLPQRERLGTEAALRIRAWLAERGVRFIGDATVRAIERARLVHLAGSEPVAGDVVLVAAGIQPRSDPIAASGLPMHEGRVVVDEHMRTEAPGLLAAGDVAYARNATAGRHLAVEHWGEAMAMGTIAGATAAGQHSRWDEVPGFWSAIGPRTLKYAAWGDGYDTTLVSEHGAEAFTIWYLTGDTVVGVLTHEADDDYERGRTLIEAGATLQGSRA
jgi:3-phenylpropionate/trans-cinnamate dioxygenase ferredoxin reductase component